MEGTRVICFVFDSDEGNGIFLGNDLVRVSLELAFLDLGLFLGLLTNEGTVAVFVCAGLGKVAIAVEGLGSVGLWLGLGLS